MRALDRRILELAASVAELDGAELHVAHAWSMPGESFLRGPFTPQSRLEIDDRLAEEGRRRQDLVTGLLRSLDRRGQRHRTHVVRGDATEVIPALARDRDVDVIVMGTLTRTGLSGLMLGNTAEEILRRVDCAVLTVKPEATTPEGEGAA